MGALIVVNPRDLHLPPSRRYGADPYKLQRQIVQFGNSTVGIPPLEVTRCKNDALQINSGVTRATRVAKLLPGQTVIVEVIAHLPNWDVSKLPTIGDLVP